MQFTSGCDLPRLTQLGIPRCPAEQDHSPQRQEAAAMVLVRMLRDAIGSLSTVFLLKPLNASGVVGIVCRMDKQLANPGGYQGWTYGAESLQYSGEGEHYMGLSPEMV